MARPLRVIFLVFYIEAWDSLDAIYRRMRADTRFDPQVIGIPRKLTGYADFSDVDLIDEFFTERGIEHEMFDYPDGEEGNRKLQELAPDYIFLNYPWQRNYQPGYRIERLNEFTKVCYVPYFSTSLVQEPEVEGVALHQYTQPTHEQAHMVFLQDQETKDAFDGVGRKDHAFLVGTPKVDALLHAEEHIDPVWPIDHRDFRGTRPFRLVWAPHHSYAQRWLNFGHFVNQKDDMLTWARTHPEVDIVFRPHPFLFGTMTDRDVMTQEEIDQWQTAWDALPNTFTDFGLPMAEILLASDALLTDGISFLVEYPLITSRPAIFWEKPDHWEFSPAGYVAAGAAITVHTFSEVVDTLTRAQAGELPDKSAEIAQLIQRLRPQPVDSAEAIVELVARDAGLGA